MCAMQIAYFFFSRITFCLFVEFSYSSVFYARFCVAFAVAFGVYGQCTRLSATVITKKKRGKAPATRITKKKNGEKIGLMAHFRQYSMRQLKIYKNDNLVKLCIMPACTAPLPLLLCCDAVHV